jgi:hypothetical protein
MGIRAVPPSELKCIAVTSVSSTFTVIIFLITTQIVHQLSVSGVYTQILQDTVEFVLLSLETDSTGPSKLEDTFRSVKSE